MATQRSNEGGRPVKFAAEGAAAGADTGGTPRHAGAMAAQHRDSGVAREPMRMDTEDDSYPGAANDESTLMHIQSMAENIARMHPSHKQRVDSVAGKLKEAVNKMC